MSHMQRVEQRDEPSSLCTAQHEQVPAHVCSSSFFKTNCDRQQAKLTWEVASTKHNLTDLRADLRRDVDALRSIRDEIKYAPSSSPPSSAVNTNAAANVRDASSVAKKH
jgi:hypothetical protein